jgi:heme-degrading monooxygenase HmoA
MYIAMNRFKIIKGEETEFERIWTERDTHLNEVPGFVEFCLLRGPEHDDHTLFVSHTVWESEKHFEGWTTSDALASGASIPCSLMRSPAISMVSPSIMRGLPVRSAA